MGKIEMEETSPGTDGMETFFLDICIWDGMETGEERMYVFVLTTHSLLDLKYVWMNKFRLGQLALDQSP